MRQRFNSLVRAVAVQYDISIGRRRKTSPGRMAGCTGVESWASFQTIADTRTSAFAADTRVKTDRSRMTVLPGCGRLANRSVSVSTGQSGVAFRDRSKLCRDDHVTTHAAYPPTSDRIGLSLLRIFEYRGIGGRIRATELEFRSRQAMMTCDPTRDSHRMG